MFRFFFLTILTSLTLLTCADASPRMIPQPPAQPLAVLVAESTTIHILEVTAIENKRGSFKTTATLKGKAEDVPFTILDLLGNAGCEGLFHKGDSVVCFREGKGENAVAMLMVGKRWAVGVSPIAWRGEKNWFCTAYDDYSVMYEGSATALREHVTTILAGHETILTARAPQGWNAVGSPRLWRIKAGPAVTNFVLSSESPHFVGWGSGEPDEVQKLIRSVGSPDRGERIAAIQDLGYLEAMAKPALPVLQRALEDHDFEISLPAAQAILRLGSQDEAIKAIKVWLDSREIKARCAALSTLCQLGPAARSALPDLLRALTDNEVEVRSLAAFAIGPIAREGPEQKEVIAAISTLLKQEKDGYVRYCAIKSLHLMGPHAWTTTEELYKSLHFKEQNARTSADSAQAALHLLTRFDPPPVDLLAEIIEDNTVSKSIQEQALRELAILGKRARAALPALRRLLRQPPKANDDFWSADSREGVVDTILAIDPEEGPALVLPILLEIAKLNERHGHSRVMYLLADCGPVLLPELPRLLELLKPDDYWENRWFVRKLVPLLRPADRNLVPALRRLLEKDNPLDLARVLFKVGEHSEAVALAVKRLESDYGPTRIEAIRWLGAQGRQAKSAAPALLAAQKRAKSHESAQITMAIYSITTDEADGPHLRAMKALDGLLALAAGESPLVGTADPQAFIRGWRLYIRTQEEEALGIAVSVIMQRLQGGAPLADILVESLRDPNPHVRLVAAMTLARVEPSHPDTVPALRRLLEGQPHFFCFAADTLVSLGRAATPLAPQLLPLLRHPDESLSRCVHHVLRSLDPALAARGWGAAGVVGAVPDDLEPLWNELAAPDTCRADLAAWRLAAAGPRAVTLLRQRLPPPTVLTPERVSSLITDLDSEEFEVRERAGAELKGASEALPAMRRTLARKPSLEVHRRIEELLVALETELSPEERRRFCGLRILEAEGSAEACDLLSVLARGDARLTLTQEAAAARTRLQKP
jgi:HEAT repeat protein